ncbi:DUF2252 domain-containing protein [soil metagenome]
MKYEGMADNPFSFLRGSCHLFYRDFPAGTSMDRAPAAWICGDLHLENFGSYKGDNRLTYFDLDDFDEGLLAPASWDLSRFLVSVLVAADALKLRPNQAESLCNCFLDAYVAALVEGKARWVERATATGMVRDLLRGLRERTQRDFLKERTDVKSGKRKLRVDGIKALPVTEEERSKVTGYIAGFAEAQPDPKFFRIVDVARRIAGLGSLGLERYVVLVRGPGGIDRNFLLDLKFQPVSALGQYAKLPQPVWTSEAERVVSIQSRVRAVSPAFLSAAGVQQRSYLVKELHPTQDRLSLKSWNGKIARLEGVMQTMGALVAWAHLRPGGREGSACADEWIEYGSQAASWRGEMLDYARSYRQQVVADWRESSPSLAAMAKKLRKAGK